jgi:hypothetical protein
MPPQQAYGLPDFVELGLYFRAHVFGPSFVQAGAIAGLG